MAESTNASGVETQHPAYPRYAARAILIRDVCENLVKEKDKQKTYLPQPNPTDKSDENRSRYASYVMRAIFMGATGHTRRGLVGAAFRKKPILERPDTLEYVETDIDGAGNSIYQQSREVVSEVLADGRHGLFVDYPETNGAVTRAQQAAEFIRASTISIEGTRIINWRTFQVGGKHMLGLVVFRDDESQPSEEDEFSHDVVTRYRVLKMAPATDEENSPLVYWVELHTQSSEGSGGWDVRSWIPQDGAGNPWSEIPFTFVGSENNDPDVDIPPLYDLATINLGHYRNSADYEDSCYMVGQAQPWASGLTQDWVRMMEEKGFQVGSRTLLPLPEGGQFGFAQVQPNQITKEAMDQKENQMAQIGARLIQPGSAPKTATEYEGESQTEHSVLSLVVSNVSAAYTQCGEWMGEFMNSTGTFLYDINQEFVRPVIDPQLLTALLAAVQAGKLPDSDFWNELRKYGVMDPERDDEATREILDETEPTLTLPNGDV